MVVTVTSEKRAAPEIRALERADREAVFAIVDRSENLTEEEKNCARELIDIYLNDPFQKDYSILAALDGPTPIGYLCYGPRPLTKGTFDLYWIVVDPARRGLGVGRALVERAAGELKRVGARLFLAETSGLPGYEEARGFYIRCGFSEEARVASFYRDGDDLVIYVKRL